MTTQMYDDFPALRDAHGKLEKARKDLKDVVDQAGGFKDMDLSKVTSLDGDNDVKLDWVRSKSEELVELKSEVDKLIPVYKAMRGLTDVDGAAVNPGGQLDYSPRGKKSLGDIVVESAAYKSKFDSGGRIKSGNGEPVYLADVGTKALFETGDGWAPENTRSGFVHLSAQRPAPHVTDVIPTVSIGQTAYVYMEETTYTNTAAETEEGGLYPEAALKLEERSQPVQKVAISLPMTDEQLEDVPGASAYINNRLQLMLQQRVDSQVILGNGTPPNLRGTLSVVGIQNEDATGQDTPDAVFRAFTKLRANAFAEPTVVLIHPTDWQEVALLRTQDGQYIWGHPSQAGPATLWGVPVLQTTVVTAGTAVTGDYQMHSLLAVKRGVDVQVTNSHADDFVHGRQAIRMDLRLGMVHIRPAAFASITNLGA